MSEYEAYWLTGFPLINIRCAPRNNYGNLLKSKKNSITKIGNFTVNRDHIRTFKWSEQSDSWSDIC